MNDRLLTDLYVALESIDEAIRDEEVPQHLLQYLVTASDNLRTFTNNVEGALHPEPAPITLGVYVTNPRTHTVHIVLDTDYTRPGAHTLCGQPVAWNLYRTGDETQSGVAATCLRCKNIMRGES